LLGKYWERRTHSHPKVKKGKNTTIWWACPTLNPPEKKDM